MARTEVEEFVTKEVELAGKLREVYFQARRLKGYHTSLGLDAKMAEVDGVPGPQTKAELDAVLAIMDALVAFLDTADRLPSLEKVNRLV